MTGLEALDKLDEVLCDIEIKHKENLGYTKPLTKSIEKSLKALEIIKEKNVDVFRFKKLDFNTFNQLQKSCKLPELTEEEFNLLKEVLI